MLTLDWHDLHHNGSPAVFRALEQIQKAINNTATMLNLLDHQLRQAQAEQATAIQELQYLWSEEIIDILSAPPLGPITPSEVVAEIGAGWRIERQQSNTQDATVGDAGTATANQTYSWMPGDVWSQYCEAVDGEPQLPR